MKIVIGSNHSSASKPCVRCKRMTNDYVVLHGIVDISIPKHPNCRMDFEKVLRAISSHSREFSYQGCQAKDYLKARGVEK